MSSYTITEIRNLFVPDRYDSEEFNEKIHILCHDSQIALQKKLDTKRYVKKTYNSNYKSFSSGSRSGLSSDKLFNIKICLNKLSPKTLSSIIGSLNTYDYNDIDLSGIFKQLHTSLVNMPLLYDEIFKLQSNLDNYIDNFTNQFYDYVLQFITETNYIKSTVTEQSLERTIRWLEYTLKYISKVYWLNFHENYKNDVCNVIDMFMKDTTTNDVYGLKMIKVIFDNIGKIGSKIFTSDYTSQLRLNLKTREKTATIKDQITIIEILKSFV